MGRRGAGRNVGRGEAEARYVFVNCAEAIVAQILRALFLRKKILNHFLLFIGGCLFCSACSIDPGILKIKGSDTEVNISVILAEAYFAQHPESRISISGGGSGVGIAALMNGLADMANSSRPISAYEENLCRERGVELIPVVFAQDALAVIVHEDVPVDSLSVSQIRAIFSGATQRWDELGIDYPRPINIYGRQSNSGTYVYFRDRLQIAFSPRAREMNGNAQIIEAIKADKQSIGYVGAGYVIKDGRQSGEGFRMLKVYEDGKAACSPLDYQKVLDGHYFFQRPLYQYVLKSSYDRVKPLLDFEKSAEGQKIIVAHGYFPAK